MMHEKHEDLSETELAAVRGGVALLLPAVQQAREAERSDTSTQSAVPTETLALNYEKVEFTY